MSDSLTLEQRITRLEDIEAIKQLKARFCYYMDQFNTEGLLTLFTEDAVLDYRPLLHQPIIGHQGIATLFDRDTMVQWERMARHQLTNAIIDVDGTSATGIWYMYGVATLIAPSGDIPIVEQLTYEDELVKTDGKWRISRLVGTTAFISPHDEGWVKTPMFDLQAQIDSPS